eukprot:g9439.t1
MIQPQMRVRVPLPPMMPPAPPAELLPVLQADELRAEARKSKTSHASSPPPPWSAPPPGGAESGGAVVPSPGSTVPGAHSPGSPTSPSKREMRLREKVYGQLKSSARDETAAGKWLQAVVAEGAKPWVSQQLQLKGGIAGPRACAGGSAPGGATSSAPGGSPAATSGGGSSQQQLPGVKVAVVGVDANPGAQFGCACVLSAPAPDNNKDLGQVEIFVNTKHESLKTAMAATRSVAPVAAAAGPKIVSSNSASKSSTTSTGASSAASSSSSCTTTSNNSCAANATTCTSSTSAGTTAEPSRRALKRVKQQQEDEQRALYSPEELLPAVTLFFGNFLALEIAGALGSAEQAPELHKSLLRSMYKHSAALLANGTCALATSSATSGAGTGGPPSTSNTAPATSPQPPAGAFAAIATTSCAAAGAAAKAPATSAAGVGAVGTKPPSPLRIPTTLPPPVPPPAPEIPFPGRIPNTSVLPPRGAAPAASSPEQDRTTALGEGEADQHELLRTSSDKLGSGASNQQNSWNQVGPGRGGKKTKKSKSKEVKSPNDVELRIEEEFQAVRKGKSLKWTELLHQTSSTDEKHEDHEGTREEAAAGDENSDDGFFVGDGGAPNGPAAAARAAHSSSAASFKTATANKEGLASAEKAKSSGPGGGAGNKGNSKSKGAASPFKDKKVGPDGKEDPQRLTHEFAEATALFARGLLRLSGTKDYEKKFTDGSLGMHTITRSAIEAVQRQVAIELQLQEGVESKKAYLGDSVLHLLIAMESFVHDIPPSTSEACRHVFFNMATLGNKSFLRYHQTLEQIGGAFAEDETHGSKVFDEIRSWLRMAPLKDIEVAGALPAVLGGGRGAAGGAGSATAKKKAARGSKGKRSSSPQSPSKIGAQAHEATVGALPDKNLVAWLRRFLQEQATKGCPATTSSPDHADCFEDLLLTSLTVSDGTAGGARKRKSCSSPTPAIGMISSAGRANTSKSAATVDEGARQGEVKESSKGVTADVKKGKKQPPATVVPEKAACKSTGSASAPVDSAASAGVGSEVFVGKAKSTTTANASSPQQAQLLHSPTMVDAGGQKGGPRAASVAAFASPGPETAPEGVGSTPPPRGGTGGGGSNTEVAGSSSTTKGMMNGTSGKPLTQKQKRIQQQLEEEALLKQELLRAKQEKQSLEQKKREEEKIKRLEDSKAMKQAEKFVRAAKRWFYSNDAKCGGAKDRSTYEEIRNNTPAALQGTGQNPAGSTTSGTATSTSNSNTNNSSNTAPASGTTTTATGSAMNGSAPSGASASANNARVHGGGGNNNANATSSSTAKSSSKNGNNSGASNTNGTSNNNKDNNNSNKGDVRVARMKFDKWFDEYFLTKAFPEDLRSVLKKGKVQDQQETEVWYDEDEFEDLAGAGGTTKSGATSSSSSSDSSSSDPNVNGATAEQEQGEPNSDNDPDASAQGSSSGSSSSNPSDEVESGSCSSPGSDRENSESEGGDTSTSLAGADCASSSAPTSMSSCINSGASSSEPQSGQSGLGGLHLGQTALDEAWNDIAALHEGLTARSGTKKSSPISENKSGSKHVTGTRTPSSGNNGVKSKKRKYDPHADPEKVGTLGFTDKSKCRKTLLAEASKEERGEKTDLFWDLYTRMYLPKAAKMAQR